MGNQETTSRKRTEVYAHEESRRVKYQLTLWYSLDDSCDNSTRNGNFELELHQLRGPVFITRRLEVSHFTGDFVCLQSSEIQLRAQKCDTKVYEASVFNPFFGPGWGDPDRRQNSSIDMRYPLVKINNNLTPRHQRVNQLFTNIDFAYLAEQDNWTPDLLESYQILIEFVASATARQEHRDYMRTGLGRDLMLRELLRRVPRFDPSPPSRPSYPVAIEDEGQDPLGSAQLPPELMMIVFGMLNGTDLVSCMQVSREWQKVASDISVPYNQTSKNLQTAWDNLFVWPGNFVDDSASEERIGISFRICTLEHVTGLDHVYTIKKPKTIQLALASVTFT